MKAFFYCLKSSLKVWNGHVKRCYWRLFFLLIFVPLLHLMSASRCKLSMMLHVQKKKMQTKKEFKNVASVTIAILLHKWSKKDWKILLDCLIKSNHLYPAHINFPWHCNVKNPKYFKIILKQFSKLVVQSFTIICTLFQETRE